MSNKPIRHGEIMLYPVNKIPAADAQKQTSFIVGHSETGHHHVLESEIPFDVLSIDKDELYVRLFEPAKLVHKKEFDKHNTLTIERGTYKVLHKTEYDPFEKVIRDVQD